jgi:aspartate oxidase
VQEVVERGVGDGPGVFVIDGAAGRGGELAEEEARVRVLAAMVDQAPHDAVVLAGLGRGRDGEQQGAVALARPGGHGLERVVGDDVELVDQGHARVPTLQRPRVGGQGHERRVGARLDQPVGVDVDP